MRIITICSDGETILSQQALWSGYGDAKNPESISKLLKDLQFFIGAFNTNKTNVSKSKEIPVEQNLVSGKRTKDEVLKEIDKLLDEINKNNLVHAKN